jgi:hypothetical protein
VTKPKVKILLCCRFRRTGKAIWQVYQCWWMCREIMTFPCSNITCFTFYIHLWPIYWFSLVNKRRAEAVKLLHEQTDKRKILDEFLQLFISNGSNRLFCGVCMNLTARNTVVPPRTYYPVICTEGLRKIKKYFNRDSLRPDSDSNCTPPEYRSRKLLLWS